MPLDQPFKLICEVRAPRRLPAGERHVRQIVRVREMIDPGQQGAREGFAVGDHAPDRDAAKAHSVIAFGATDQAEAAAITACPVVGERDLECGIDRLRTGIGEEHVLETVPRSLSQRGGQFKRLVMTGLKGGRIVKHIQLPFYGFDNLRMPMSRVAAP